MQSVPYTLIGDISGNVRIDMQLPPEGLREALEVYYSPDLADGSLVRLSSNYLKPENGFDVGSNSPVHIFFPEGEKGFIKFGVKKE